jgi:hypothetical protein
MSPKDERNTQLVDAAPDLLEACKWMQRWYERCVSRVYSVGLLTDDEYEDALDASKFAQDAITRAEGCQ